jgi:post-segregation antitoxin (ccd killing protein)
MMPDTNVPETNARRATNVTLPEALVAMAKVLGVNTARLPRLGWQQR